MHYGYYSTVYVELEFYMMTNEKQLLHCGESRIFWDAADQTLPVTEFSEIYITEKLNSVLYLGIFSYR
jgi:hypothetical protein